MQKAGKQSTVQQINGIIFNHFIAVYILKKITLKKIIQIK